MKRQLHLHQAVRILPLLMLVLVSACDRPTVQGVQTFPRPADLQAVTTPEPLPSPNIADDPQAEARDNAAIELWGRNLRDAGVRICKWATERGLVLSFKCDRKE